MTEEDNKRPTDGPAVAPANDAGDDLQGDAGEAAEFPDEATPLSSEDRLAALEAELADTRERLLRALAETENVRRRFQREREDAQKYAVSGAQPADQLARAIREVSAEINAEAAE